MARVVQRRTPPYLLIVFVILFVFAASMAVLFFTKYDGAQKQHLEEKEVRKQLADSEQLKRAEIRQMRNQYIKSAKAGMGSTVVTQLNSQIAALADAITGLPNTTFLEAKQEIDKTFQVVKPPVRRGLVKHMTDFNEQLGVKEAEITKLNADKTQLTTELNAAKQALADAKTDFDTKLKQKDDQIAALDQKFQNFETDHNNKLAGAKKEYQTSVEEINKQVAAQADQIKDLDRETRRWKKKYEIEIDKKVRPAVDADRIVRRPDGKVLRVLADENLVYINIGSKNRVTEDLRLTVYPYTGIPDSGAGKAVVEVINVSDSVSECRIIEQAKDDPVIPGDLVANLVYDALRTYSFVVEGEFDIDGSGVPSIAGNKAIKELVRRYGGRLMNDVSIDSDYVILGDPPARPRKPDDTDPPDVWNLYNDRLKSFNRYKAVKDDAEGHQIPRLGGKRFLDLIGYIPTKVASTE
ncbi:MAG: hypothetical protein WBF17_04900 [Phycisphaerae bacterium]